MYDVFGIGSALMDFMVEVDEQRILEFDLKKGHFHLLDEEQTAELLRKIKGHVVKTSPGGSSANTLYGVALLGGKVVFCGKIGTDEHGNVYEEKMTGRGVRTRLARSSYPTGHALTFITPDSERTFAVHLGAALHLTKEDVFFEDLKQSKILHIEGYQLEDKSLRKVSLHAMRYAKRNKVMISIDLGDPGIVSRNRMDLQKIIRTYADIIFANEEEARALTGLQSEDALGLISKMCKIAVVKLGRKGSLMRTQENTFTIPAYPIAVVDTTGAGDMFAAGVLFGITHGFDVNTSGHLGSYFAAKVCGQLGARLAHIDKKELTKVVHHVNTGKH